MKWMEIKTDRSVELQKQTHILGHLNSDESQFNGKMMSFLPNGAETTGHSYAKK